MCLALLAYFHNSVLTCLVCLRAHIYLMFAVLKYFRCEVACVLDVIFYLICFTFPKVKTQKHSISTVSMFSVIMFYSSVIKFYSLGLCKIGNLDIIVIKIFFIYLCYNLFDLLFVYFCSFSFRIVNKMIDFCHEKAYVKL